MRRNPAMPRLVMVGMMFVVMGNVAELAPGQENSTKTPAGPSAAWKNGPAQGSDYFPIAVWLQAPTSAPKYKQIGINLYIGLWSGPTEEQLAELTKHGMPVICEQNALARKRLDEKIIVGWMHGDEPDNAQSLGQGKGYGPPIPAAKIIEDYKRIKANDATRPVVLNLGQGVAWDGWHGRGVRTSHPEDYAEYVKGGDIVSFDIYPAVHDRPAIAGKLWYVPRGVARLCEWTGGQKVVWDCIECTRIGNPDKKPTPAQVKAEVWMSIIHGSRGLIYFCHQFQPTFIEAGLLADEEMCAAVAQINRQIQELAAVINEGPRLAAGLAPRSKEVSLETDPADVSPELAAAMPGATSVAVMLKRHAGVTYLFSVRMEDKPAKATFTVAGLSGPAKIEVLGENRTLSAADGKFSDEFAPYAVHIYRIAGRASD